MRLSRRATGRKEPPGGLFPFRFFQFPIDPKLDPPDGKQIELGFGLARDDPLADAELPSPGARSDRRHGVFDALVNHIKIPPRAPNRFKSNLILKIVTINQYNYKTMQSCETYAPVGPAKGAERGRE